MQKFSDVVLDKNGKPVTGLTITVTTYPGGQPATIYGADGGPAVDSVKTDSSGRFSFYAANGHYTVTVSGTGITPVIYNDVTLFDPLDDRINVRDFITTAVDGATSNQTGIVAAVAAAYAAGKRLHWPGGPSHVSTATIPNFHAVRHVGAGSIKRGNSVFYVEPREGQTNTLNVSPTGSNTNDGLDAAQPFATWQAAFDAMKNYGPVLSGTWQVSGVGTFDFSAGAQTHSTPSKNRVIIKGPSVGGHPNVPTCIIDGGGNGAAYSHGLNLDGIGVRVEVQDIKVQNFSEASGNTRLGIVAANGADFYTNNVHGLNCSWAAINAKECEQVRISGGILDCGTNGAYGIISDSSHSSVGYNAGSLAGGPIVRNAKSAGVYWSTGSQGHCDYVTYEDCAVGFLCAENSRADTVGNNYKRCTTAKRAQTGGWFASGGAAETFNDGTADANVTNVEFKAFSGDISEGAAQGSGSWQRMAFDRTLRNASGIVADTFPSVYTIAANRLTGVGKSCRVHVMGVYTVTAGSSLTVNIGGMAFTLNVPAAASNTAFEIDVELMDVAGGYRAIGKLAHSLASPRFATATSGFVTGSANNVSIGYSLAGSGDSLNIYRTDVYLMG